MILLDSKSFRWAAITIFLLTWHLIWWQWVSPRIPVSRIEPPAPFVQYQPQVQSTATRRYWSPIFVGWGLGAAFSDRSSEVPPPLGVALELSVTLDRTPDLTVPEDMLAPKPLQLASKQLIQHFSLPAKEPKVVSAKSPSPVVHWSVDYGAAREEILGLALAHLATISTNESPWKLSLDLETNEEGNVDHVLVENSSGQRAIDHAAVRAVYGLRREPAKASSIRLSVAGPAAKKVEP